MRQGEEARRPRRRDPRAVATRLLAIRARSVGALRERLVAQGFAAAETATVIREFSARGLLDDAHFAQALIDEVLREKPVGRQFLLSKLRRYRVPDEIAHATLSAILPLAREGALAREAAWKKLAELRRHLASPARPQRPAQRFGRARPIATSSPLGGGHRGPAQRLKARLARFLSSRGFPASVIAEVTADVLQGEA